MNYKDQSANSKIISDIETLKNALESYNIEQEILPLPLGNNNFFKEDTSYTHSGATAF